MAVSRTVMSTSSTPSTELINEMAWASDELKIQLIKVGAWWQGQHVTIAAWAAQEQYGLAGGREKRTDRPVCDQCIQVGVERDAHPGSRQRFTVTTDAQGVT